jgi:alcohol dehydrogenase (NADP+)
MSSLLAILQLALGAGIVFSPLTSGPIAAKGVQPERIPFLGLGTWHIHDNDNNVTDLVGRALEMGYRHIDCAYSYGNQKQIGKGIAYGLERTGLSRKDIWVTSKLWNNR